MKQDLGDEAVFNSSFLLLLNALLINKQDEI